MERVLVCLGCVCALALFGYPTDLAAEGASASLLSTQPVESVISTGGATASLGIDSGHQASASLAVATYSGSETRHLPLLMFLAALVGLWLMRAKRRS
ncbi:MAG: hypothetical protein AAGE18_02325 [Pseudomonadota bacterium]